MPSLVQPPAIKRLMGGAKTNMDMKKQPGPIQRMFGSTTVNKAANKYKRNPK